MQLKSESEVAQSCPTLSSPMDCSLPGSSTHGIFQTRTLEWVVMSFSNVWKWKVKMKWQYTALMYSISYLEPVCLEVPKRIHVYSILNASAINIQPRTWKLYLALIPFSLFMKYHKIVVYQIQYLINWWRVGFFLLSVPSHLSYAMS